MTKVIAVHFVQVFVLLIHSTKQEPTHYSAQINSTQQLIVGMKCQDGGHKCIFLLARPAQYACSKNLEGQYIFRSINIYCS